MNKLDRLARAYSRLHNYPGVPRWVLSPLRRCVRSISNKVLPSFLSSGQRPPAKERGNVPVIVSFTSFPARIQNVWQVVECMLRQTYMPSKIILWLSTEQFPVPDSIPQTLRVLEGDVFEIRMVEGDIRSHKKYYYVFSDFPNALVFLVDDDLYYPSDILERSVAEYMRGEASAVCNYGFRITYDNGKILPYRRWHREVHYSTSPNLFFGSGGGTLIDTSKLNEMVVNIDLARRLTPTADDIWLNAMIRLSDMKVSMLSNGLFLPIKNTDGEKLSAQNMWEDQNDVQLSNLIDYFRSVGIGDMFACR